MKRDRGDRRPRPRGQFPGEIAGASLKLLEVRPGGALGRQFPGEIAGASLKPRAEEAEVGDGVPNSPAKSPGPH